MCVCARVHALAYLSVYLVGLCVIRTLCILGLFDVLYHLPKKGVTVVLVLGHQHFQHEPQAPTHININMLYVTAVVITTCVYFFSVITQHVVIKIEKYGHF